MSVLTLGIDCGGTSTKLLLAAESDGVFTEMGTDRFPTPRNNDALSFLTHKARALLGDRPLGGFGIAMPGIIDDATSVVTTSTNLAWVEGLAPADVVGDGLGVPGVLVHDGAATAKAEATLGAARDYSDAFVLALGTGVAGAHIVAGQIRRGAHGGAGEIGHISQGPGRVCSCGQRGCLETFIGGARLGTRWQEHVKDKEPVTAVDLTAAAATGNQAALAILDEATTALAKGVLGMIALIDPEIVVIGGGVARARGLVIDPTVAKTHAMATFHHVPPIVPAALGMWGAAWGAVLAAHDSWSGNGGPVAERGRPANRRGSDQGHVDLRG